MRNEAELEYEQMCAELDHLRECDKASRKRIAELEAKNMDAAVAHGKQLERIAELEALVEQLKADHGKELSDLLAKSKEQLA